jgi:hypothetical protein
MRIVVVHRDAIARAYGARGKEDNGRKDEKSWRACTGKISLYKYVRTAAMFRARAGGYKCFSNFIADPERR